MEDVNTKNQNQKPKVKDQITKDSKRMSGDGKAPPPPLKRPFLKATQVTLGDNMNKTSEI